MNIDTQSVAIDLDQLKKDGRIFRANSGASIIDIGDRVGLVEFHTKANSITDDICEMLLDASSVGSEYFDALVIGNRGKHFCAGANLPHILELAKSGSWSALENILHTFQHAAMLLKYGPMPVVAAPFSSTLGGGCEICLHSARVVLADNTHMGLVETGVGLIPGGGGTKELCLRALELADQSDEVSMLHALHKPFELIMNARVSSSGAEATEQFLKTGDFVVSTQESPIEIAKKTALDLVQAGHSNGAPKKKIPVLGSDGILVFNKLIDKMRSTNQITDHDAFIGMQVATILCGGNQPAGFADEQHFLDREREAFLELMATPKTQQRIEYLLSTNKILRN